MNSTINRLKEEVELDKKNNYNSRKKAIKKIVLSKVKMALYDEKMMEVLKFYKCEMKDIDIYREVLDEQSLEYIYEKNKIYIFIVTNDSIEKNKLIVRYKKELLISNIISICVYIPIIAITFFVFLYGVFVSSKFIVDYIF